MGNTTVNDGSLTLHRLQIDADEIAIFLGPLEAAIMRAVWQGATNTRAIYKYVRDNYEPTSSAEIAFTSVTSTVDRLYKRGLLIRGGTRDEYTYTASVPNERAFIDVCITQTLDKLLEYYPFEVAKHVAAFVRANSAKKDLNNGK